MRLLTHNMLCSNIKVRSTPPPILWRLQVSSKAPVVRAATSLLFFRRAWRLVSRSFCTSSTLSALRRLTTSVRILLSSSPLSNEFFMHATPLLTTVFLQRIFPKLHWPALKQAAVRLYRLKR
jgi:hypothetical protein